MIEKNASLERYHRQVILKELGEPGQRKLLAAKVLVIGAGGLGCPVLQYLTAAGVGTLGVIDHDVVSLSNLHRQVLFDMNDIGKTKAERAAVKLRQLNPDVQVFPYNKCLTNQNALDILEPYDIIVDASDNFPTRYLVNDACVLLNKPFVYGAVSRWEGQVAVFNAAHNSAGRTVNYRDLFPVQPQEGEIANCAEAGVLGVLPGIIGSLQAGEVIKLITGIGKPLVNQLQTFNLNTNEWFAWEVSTSVQADALLPKDKAAFINMDYENTCILEGIKEINVSEFNNLLQEKGVTVIDVRERGEQPLVDEFAHLQIPLSQLKEKIATLDGDNIITFCQTGKRSGQAARLLANTYTTKKIYSLRGGIMGWKQHLQLSKHE
jgi:sulfur-carrier protein adenylyltransferase/sulfurtransferase